MTIEMEFTRQRFLKDYSNLREQFLMISKPHIVGSILNTLKTHFSSVIKSVRVSDYIDSIEGLIRILEKRNALSYENIEPLKHISSLYIRDPVLERALRDYEDEINARPPVPLYNIYNVPSGEYNCLFLNISQQLSSLSHQSIITVVTNSKNVNNKVTNYNYQLLSSEENQEISEALLIHNIEQLILNNSQNLIGEQNNHDYNNHICFGELRHKFCSTYSMNVLGTFIAAALLIILTIVCNTMSVKSSGLPSSENQTIVTGLQDNYNEIQQRRQQINAQVTFSTAQRLFHLTIPGSIQIGSTGQNIAESEQELQKIVLFEVSEKLGRHWRDVARFLDVTEYDIDEIDNKLQLSLREKALKALQIFQSKSHPQQWKSKLKRALDKARRRDLMEMVDDISSQTYR